jgi:hypothetical protein
MTHEELDTLWDKSVNESIKAGDGLARYRYAEYVAAAEREDMAEYAAVLAEAGWSAWSIADALRARGSKT